MRHAVLGAGNLGIDIATEIAKHSENSFQLFSKKHGFKYPCSLDSVLDYMPDHVWVTVGAGSVGEANKNYVPFVDLHIRLVMELAQQLPERTELHVFSTDYIADENKIQSLYALSKLHMEKSLYMLGRSNVHIYRVSNLYGLWKPQNCFPYKLKKRHPSPCTVTVPSNSLTPTPTDWLASVLVTRLMQRKSKMPDDVKMLTASYNAAPFGRMTIKEWASYILDSRYEIIEGEEDKERPLLGGGIGCDFKGLGELDKTEHLWVDRRSKWETILKEIENAAR